MAKCGAIKKDGERCTFNAKGDSGYCGKHKNYKADKSDTDEKRHEELIEKIEELEKKSESTKKKLLNKIEESEKKSESRFWRSVIISSISILIAIGGVWIGYWYFTEQVKLSSPVILQVNHTVKYINSSEGILEINVTNTHDLRKTGAIYLYRLEINPNKPYITIDGLEPTQSLTYNLSFKTKKEVIKPVTDMYYNGYTVYFHENSSEMSKILYVYEHISISYKISCDNCPSQGVIIRVHDFGKGEYLVGIKNIGGTMIKSEGIPIYEWEDYKLEDVLQNESIR